VEVWQTSNLRRLRLGEEKKKEERRTNHSMKIYMVSLLHRATINNRFGKKVNGHIKTDERKTEISIHQQAIAFYDKYQNVPLPAGKYAPCCPRNLIGRDQKLIIANAFDPPVICFLAITADCFKHALSQVRSRLSVCLSVCPR